MMKPIENQLPVTAPAVVPDFTKEQAIALKNVLRSAIIADDRAKQCYLTLRQNPLEYDDIIKTCDSDRAINEQLLAVTEARYGV